VVRISYTLDGKYPDEDLLAFGRRSERPEKQGDNLAERVMAARVERARVTSKLSGY
jgi:hypothetical protein